MKNVLFAASAAAIIMATACNSASSDTAKTDSAQTEAMQTGKSYTADTTNSVIGWRATHKGGMAPRFGTLHVSNGDLAAENGKVTGGTFTVNINSLVVDTTSVTETDKKAIDLQNHLKSPDFFDAAKYPTAKFTITSVAAYDSTAAKSLLPGATNIVSGNLTIKDSTVNITFPAKIVVTDASIDLEAKFTVDRTSWGLSYGAKGDAADWLISKDFELMLNIKAVSK